jgi:hypothetical protein
MFPTPYIKKLLTLMNLTYKALSGYVLGEEVLMNQLVCDKDENLVAFGLMIPSHVKALKRIQGHLFPFGSIGFFKELKTSKVLDMMVVVVHHDYKKSRALSLILVESIQHLIDPGIAFAETDSELSYNQEVESLWKHFQTRQHKTRSAFLKKISL